MKRRQFLFALAALGATGGLASLALRTEVAAVAAVIHKRLSYLRLDRDGVKQFAHEYVSRGLTSARKLRALSASRWIYERTPQSWLGFLAPGFEFGEDRIVSAFLLSSDLFPGRDERRVVRYVGFFDGRLRANPFARLVVQAA